MPDSDSSSDSTTHEAPSRIVIGAVAAFYVALFAALIWPIYPAFATIEPRVLSMPFSLAYVVGALILSFVVLLWLYLREHTGEGDPQVGEGDPQVGEGEPQDGGESTGRHG